MKETKSRGLLAGWKAIAAYFNRDERTVMRWAASRGLPVKRGPGGGRSTVYADPAELERWLRAGGDWEATAPPESPSSLPPAPSPAPAATIFARLRRSGRVGLAAALLLVLVAAGIAATFFSFRSAPTRVDNAAALPSDPEARGVFLQATYDWNQRTASSLARAVREYGEVIASDPRFAPAYIGLANTYLLMREYGAMPDSEAYPRAAAAAEAALVLSPNAPAAHRALAFVAFWWQADRERARREFETAIRLDPKNPLTHQWLATALAANGQTQDALHQMTIARSLDPVSSSTLVDYLLLGYLANRDARDTDALRALAKAQPAFSSTHRVLADIALFEGWWNDYLQEATLAADLRQDADSKRDLALQSRRYAEGGSAALQAALIEQARASRSPSHDFQLARALSIAGQGDQATKVLAQVCRNREPGAVMAPGDLWLTRSIPAAREQALCPAVSLGG